MKRFALLLILSTSLTACGMDAATKQWLNPDKEFAELDQPEVETVNQTLEKQAQTALGNGDFARAGQFYEQLLGAKKITAADKLRYQLALADLMRRTGQYDKSITAFEEILRNHPGNLDAEEGRALALMSQGKATDAGRAFSTIMDEDSKRWRTLNALGILFVTKNMIPEAMQYYTEALKQSPDNPAILNNIGLSRAVERDFPRAIEAFEQAIRLAGPGERRKQIELNMAMVYGVSGDLDTAKSIASKYLQGPALDNNLGLYAHLAKDNALAKTYLNMALSKSPSFYERAWENLDLVDQSKAE